MTVIDKLERNAGRWPDGPALFYRNECYTYGELNDMVGRVAASLAAMGVKKGDVTALALERTPPLVIALLASMRIGAVPAPVNFNLGGARLSKLFHSQRPVVIFTAARFLERVEGAERPKGSALVVCGGGPDRHLRWDELLSGSAAPPAERPDFGDVAYLNYTSGSTGEPKGAVTTCENIYWNTRSAVEVFGIDEDAVHLCMFAPFAHPHEFIARPIYTAGAMVLLDEIFPKSWPGR